MEELIRRLTEAISDFNRYIKNEYSAINKNYSGISNSLGDYSIFTIVAPKLNNFKINKTFPRANYIMTKIDNSTDVVYITTNTATKEKLEFRDGSRYEGIFSDLYLSYDFTGYNPMPKVQIFIGYNSKFIPITTVKIADIDSNNPLPISITEEQSINYNIASIGGNVNNTLVTQLISSTLNGQTVKGISSILITNLDSTNTLYVGNNFGTGNYNTVATPILAGEKLTIDFKQMAKAPFSFLVFSPNDVNYQVSVVYAY